MSYSIRIEGLESVRNRSTEETRGRLKNKYSCMDEMRNSIHEMGALSTSRCERKERWKADVSSVEEEDTKEGNAIWDGELHYHYNLNPTPTNYQSIRRSALTESTSELRNWD